MLTVICDLSQNTVYLKKKKALRKQKQTNKQTNPKYNDNTKQLKLVKKEKEILGSSEIK